MDKTLRDKIGPLAFRLALASICLVHGFLKIQVAGGAGWDPGLATHWQLAISWGELVFGSLVLLGMQCRPAAAGLFLIVAGEAILHYSWDFWKFPVLQRDTTFVVLLLSLGVASIGGGDWIVDLHLGGAGKSARKKSPALQP